MSISKEIKVAIFVIIAGVMFYTGFNFLKGIDFFSSTNRYYSQYKDVSGLQLSNPVMVNGLNVGRVSDIKIINDEYHTLRVQFDVNKDVVVGEGTIAVISSPDLLGGKAVVLKLGNHSKPLEPGTEITGSVEVPLTEKIMEKADPILKQLELTVKNVNGVVSEKNSQSLSNMISHLEQTSKNLNQLLSQNATNIAHITTNLRNLSSSLAEAGKQLKPLISKANTLADSLNKMQLASTVENLNSTIKEINTLVDGVNKGQGSLGKLVKDDSLYTNLNNSARDLDKLLIDFKARPKRYVHFSVFGSKAK